MTFVKWIDRLGWHIELPGRITVCGQKPPASDRGVYRMQRSDNGAILKVCRVCRAGTQLRFGVAT